MEIRDNVRRRRRERIVQLTGSLPDEQKERSEPRPDAPLLPEKPESRPVLEIDPDPEKWWKEQQKRRNADGPVWPGVSRLPSAARPPGAGIPDNRNVSKFLRGFLLRILSAAVLFGAAWGWFHSGIPGSVEARDWTVAAITRDMDFQAVESWYEQTFGGSSSFLPMFRNRGESQAVSGGWNRNEAVLPAEGRIVRTFAQDGSGVRIAAAGGSGVKAVYAGRVLNVATEDNGKATVLVQHAGRIVTVYGNVEKPAVLPNDWVEAGQALGTVPAPLDDGGESLLYFAVKQNGKTLDPAEVVPFD